MSWGVFCGEERLVCSWENPRVREDHAPSTPLNPSSTESAIQVSMYRPAERMGHSPCSGDIQRVSRIDQPTSTSNTMSSAKPQRCIQLHALQAGHLTLPERFFVHPFSDTARRTVPSLSFLLQHLDTDSGKTTRIVFDLGLRHPTSNYPVPIQRHIQTRQPLITEPDVVKSLEEGGLSPSDIDFVIYSHVRNPSLSARLSVVFDC
jgi:hypothetical protein